MLPNLPWTSLVKISLEWEESALLEQLPELVVPVELTRLVAKDHLMLRI
jgi:hypothetical protein